MIHYDIMLKFLVDIRYFSWQLCQNAIISDSEVFQITKPQKWQESKTPTKQNCRYWAAKLKNQSLQKSTTLIDAEDGGLPEGEPAAIIIEFPTPRGVVNYTLSSAAPVWQWLNSQLTHSHRGPRPEVSDGHWEPSLANLLAISLTPFLRGAIGAPLLSLMMIQTWLAADWPGDHSQNNLEIF